jgi:hypothetical protein
MTALVIGGRVKHELFGEGTIINYHKFPSREERERRNDVRVIVDVLFDSGERRRIMDKWLITLDSPDQVPEAGRRSYRWKWDETRTKSKNIRILMDEEE